MMATVSLRSTAFLPLLLIVVAVTAVVGVAASSKPDEPACTCYRTSSGDYFTNHLFFDFRNVAFPGSVPPLQSTLPASADDQTGQSADDVGQLQTGFISSRDWTDSWSIQDWGKGRTNDTKYRMWNSLSNVFIDSNTDGNPDAKTKLVLRTRRFDDFQSSGEVENLHKNLLFASTRIRARVRGDAGAVAGLFYFRNSANESDIEILTRDQTSEIRYSNQPVVDQEGNEIKDSSTLVDMNSDKKTDGTQLPDRRRAVGARNAMPVAWTDWHTHRIDWVTSKSSWFVDGRHYLDKAYGVPTVPSYLILNMWSDGGMWSGEMQPLDEARLEIEWVEMVFNISDESPSRSKFKTRRRLRRRATQAAADDYDDDDCSVVCTVDDAGATGILNGGIQSPRLSAAGPRNSTLWSGTDDRQFIIATAIGATVAAVLYIIDTTF